jgi:hypothetical protein
MVLEALADAANQPPPCWSEHIHFEDFTKGLQRWREATSTSPSGRHLGTYKTLLAVYFDKAHEFKELPEPASALTIQAKAEKILRVIHGLASTAARKGFYLKRWLRVINVMIYKEPGNFKLEKLRVIHLFEADFNITVGILFGRRAMYHAKQHKLIHENQGGRLGSDCMDVAFTKVLHFTMAHLTKTPLGLFESDAESCFDRIVMLMAFMAFKAMGAPSGPLRMWEQTLYNVQHELRTGYGESDGSYTYTASTPIFGPGQGSRGGVAAVCAMTTFLLRAFDKMGHGASFCSPAQSNFYKGISKMYIDDASNYVNLFLRWLHIPTDQLHVTDILQGDAQTWERLLHTSGGKLRPDKCLYYILTWLFDEEGHASLATPDEEGHLSLTAGDSNDQEHPIEQYPYNKAHRTLGVYLAPDFQTTTALQILRHKVDRYATRIVRGNLSRYDSWICYFTCFLPKITYGLDVMTHSRKDLTDLQKPAIAATLSKLGFRRSISRAIVFGSPTYGGLGLRDLHVEQGIAQLQLFIRHLRAKSPQGKLLHIALSWWQLQAGVSWALLERPDQPLHYLPSTWLTSLRTFLADIQGTLTVTAATAELPSLARAEDQYLMSALLGLPSVTTSDLHAFNRVRLFLGVTVLAEITSADGQHLTQEAWRGDRPRHSPLLWPFQPQPGPKSFAAWRRLLTKAFLQRDRAPRAHTNLQSLQLQVPLGSWSADSQWLQSKWTAFYSYTTHRLYRQDPSDPTRFFPHQRWQRSRTRRPQFQPDPDDSSAALPPFAIPVDACTQPNFISFPSITRIQNTSLPAREQIRPTFAQYITALPLWDKTLLQHMDLGDIHIDVVLGLLVNPLVELILGSDGGAKDRRGSFGALIASQEGPHNTRDQILVELGGIAYGDTPRSFRAESYGQLAVVRLLFHFTRHFHIRIRCRCRFLLDNSGRLLRTRTIINHPQPTPRRYLISDFDIDMELRDTLHQLRLRSVDEHIHSHQEHTSPADLIPWKTQINSRCDALATAHLRRQTQPSVRVPFLPASTAMFELHQRTITRALPSQTRHICGSTLPYTNDRSQLQHLCRIHDWTYDEFHQIDWAVFDSITNKKASFPNRLFLIKWLNNILPLQARQHHMHLTPSASCPSECGCLFEDEAHLLRCPHPDRCSIYPKLVLTLRILFQKHHVDPWLRQLLFSSIADAHPATPFNLTALTPQYRTLAANQANLGTSALFFGFFHTDWIRLQDDYLRSQHKPTERNQSRHAIELIAMHFQATARAQWDARNLHLHETHDAQLPFIRTVACQETSLIYGQLDTLLPLDRPAITQGISLPDRLEHSTKRLKHWLRRTRPLFKFSQRQAKQRPAHTHDIRSYFHTGRPPGHQPAG